MGHGYGYLAGMGMGQSLEYPLPMRLFTACSSVLLPPLTPYCHHSCPTTTTHALLPPLTPYTASYPPSHSSCLVPPSTLLALSSVLRTRPSHISIRRHAPGVCAKHWWLLGSGGGGYTRTHVYGYIPVAGTVICSLSKNIVDTSAKILMYLSEASTCEEKELDRMYYLSILKGNSVDTSST
ncbi:hypothetical protein BDR03DRAFT_986242 [Suillus americanus]|nr:hypothetical protein BDR03DRAFT_986242 [Suillus americanus]